jgi:DNA invertase Pin-like site-specific DNA recombinase
MAKAYSYIRLSSDAQKRGDGFRRQADQSRQYALKHGLELDESFVQPNRAESAFRGDNATTGTLGRFLDACENGQVEAGSYLLVESLDRLSRQQVFKSLALFMRLMTAGITIVTLIDERSYNITTSNENDVLVMLGAMGRAHDESRTKSVRGRKNWEQKRAGIAEKKLTATGPANCLA